MADCEWFPIVSEVYSSKEAVKNRDKLFEHLFTIDYEENRPIKLLRIDIQDRFYLKDFSLIYTDTGEVIEGIQAGNDFRFRFICVAKKGNYKIVTKGGKYCYSVFMLESNLKLQQHPVCKARSPFNILARLPIKEDALYRQVAFRTVGTTEWETAGPSLKKVSFDVDPTSAYDVKMKLVAADLFETEYSPIITTTLHQIWTNQFETNIDFFNTTLLFEIQMQTWLSNVSMTLKYKTNVTAQGDWICITKPPMPTDQKWTVENFVKWDLEDKLYKQSLTQDMTMEWQLEFKNTETNQIAASQVRKLELRKRHKIQRGESIRSNLLKFDSSNYRSIYLSRDGQFWYRQIIFDPSFTHTTRIDFSGNFILVRKNANYRRRTITLMNIKFWNLRFENCMQNDDLSTKLLPELVKVILSVVWGLPHSSKLKSDVSLNLVCKNWCNMFADGLLQVEGALMDDYSAARHDFAEGGSLKFTSWRNFFQLGRDKIED